MGKYQIVIFSQFSNNCRCSQHVNIKMIKKSYRNKNSELVLLGKQVNKNIPTTTGKKYNNNQCKRNTQATTKQQYLNLWRSREGKAVHFQLRGHSSDCLCWHIKGKKKQTIESVNIQLVLCEDA